MAGAAREELLGDLKLSKATHHRWKNEGKARPNEKSGPKPPSPELLELMKMEIADLDHVTRRTHGTEAVYNLFEGIIPRRVIHDAIEEERRRTNRVAREGVVRYEFAAPRVAYSADFVEPAPGGRILRAQDECSRLHFPAEYGVEWAESSVARHVSAVFQNHGVPYFFKHDLGTEFRSGLFQSMLRGLKVIPLPNPPHYPQANGKNERANRDVGDWLAAIPPQELTVPRLLEELARAADAHNRWPQECLGRRRPLDVWQNLPTPSLSRGKLHAEWLALRDELLGRHRVLEGILPWAGEWEAARLASLVVLQRHRLVRYSTGREAPKL